MVNITEHRGLLKSLVAKKNNIEHFFCEHLQQTVAKPYSSTDTPRFESESSVDFSLSIYAYLKQAC